MRRLLTAVVVLVALFVAADRLSVWYAQKRIADELRKTENLSSTPSVKIHGFPFLTQLFGRLDDVEVVITDYQRGSAPTVDRIDVHLHGADVPVGDAFSGNAVHVPVKHVDAVVRFDYGTLGRAHDGLRFSYAGNNRVRVSGAVTVAGVTAQASATGHVVLNTDNFAVGIDSVTAAGTTVTTAADPVARRLFGVSTSLPSLPFHFRLDTVRATKNGIEIVGSADNVVLTRSAR